MTTSSSESCNNCSTELAFAGAAIVIGATNNALQSTKAKFIGFKRIIRCPQFL